ncbi:MAG TPA: hypothetical protein VFV47_07860, partial [Hyphomicrobiaceae bacterium]|nr:hypothetical protein [Hyphomicrobiaceae bacterium]
GPLTADDCARYDYAPAVAAILAETGASSVQVVAHCFGALTLSMALLAGHVKGVRSAILSQVALDVVAAGAMQRVLAHLRAAVVARKLGQDRIDMRPSAAGTVVNGWLDRLGAMTAGDKGARGRQSGAFSLLFGAPEEDAQMDHLSAEAAADLTGEISTGLLANLELMVRCKVPVDARGENVYMPRLDRMAFPIALLQGGRNACFDPSGTDRSLTKLSARNGARLYERHLFAGYGHNDCLIGRNAARDVYPAVLAHLERFQSV